jgi:hypothetical protein
MLDHWYRAANQCLPSLGRSYNARKSRWLLRWSTTRRSINHVAQPHIPQPTIDLPSGNRRLLLSLHCHLKILAKYYPALDPHSYTSGRWLRHDKLQRDARYIKFDFDALRKRVIELCPGASSVVSYEKKEGGFNRVFIFTCDNGKRSVARLPTRVAGPCRLTTHSEVATIKYRESG